MALERKLRKKLNEAILEVEAIDPYDEDPKIFERKIIIAREILDRNGVLAESDYRARLRTIEEIARQAFEQKKIENKEQGCAQPAEQNKNQIQTYSGFLRRMRIKVSSYTEGYSLKRFPEQGKDNSFRWKFNPKGRLENLDFTTKFGSKPIVSTSCSGSPNEDFAQITTYPIPREALFFTSGIQNKLKKNIYGTLIEFGYDYIKDFLNDIKSKRIKQYPVFNGEIALAEIINNNSAMEMIKTTAGIIHYIDEKSPGEYVIRYEQ